MHRGDREDGADRADHALVDADVALNPLRAHDEAWAQLARIAHAIARTHAGALRGRVHGDERGIGVLRTGDDAHRTPVQARIGGLLARGEETVGVEVEPRSLTGHVIALYEEGASVQYGFTSDRPVRGLDDCARRRSGRTLVATA